MRIQRLFTMAGQDPLELLQYERRSSIIKNPDGTVVKEIKNVEVPVTWSQVATDILAQKYFRKAGVPQVDAQGKPVIAADGKQLLGSETSAKQVVRRLAGTWRWWGEQHGYFATREDAQAYQDEMETMLIKQMAAPNSPQWFNTGLNWAYGITGQPQGHYYINPQTGALHLSEDAYTHPQPHACFIQKVNDDLVNEGGIFDLVTREARLFKFGSGTGSNFSNLRGRGEKLSGGGSSSGMMSFLKIFDRSAGK
jgi:ribonucleoside-diphosphate reductase alpha chain